MATVLVVDDNPTNILLAKAALTARGYAVTTAGSASEAEAVLARDVPDLILMDVQLPEVDGLTLTRQLKADPRVSHIPIIALTALAMAGDEERVRAAGCDGYITKPFRPDHLVEQVGAALAARSGS